MTVKKTSIRFFSNLNLLISINLVWSIGGIYADWTWLSSIPLHLVPFTAICSLYPPLLLITFILEKIGYKIPNFLLAWLFIACGTYGILALFYFPALMYWDGFNWYRFGSIFWVAVYGLQTFSVYSRIKKISCLDLVFPILFLAAADYCHFFLRTFWDFNMTNYPTWLKYGTGFFGLSLQIFFLMYLKHFKVSRD